MPDIQPDFESMYFQLFGKVADAIQLLQRAQQEAEERYIAAVPPKPQACMAATPAEPGEQGAAP